MYYNECVFGEYQTMLDGAKIQTTIVLVNALNGQTDQVHCGFITPLYRISAICRIKTLWTLKFKKLFN